MNIDSNDWQVIGGTVYRLFTDKSGDRCNEFTIQISSNYEVNLSENERLAEKLCDLLNEEEAK